MNSGAGGGHGAEDTNGLWRLGNLSGGERRSHPAEGRTLHLGLRTGKQIEVTVNLFQDKNSGFPGDTVVKNLPANAGNTGSSSGPGTSHMPQSN